jgi:prepilin-type N-terminal cleavage/methylation domain-containing protein
MKLIANSVSRLRCRAFSLIEVTIATAISGIMFLSLYSGISWGFATIKVAREDLRATQIALEKMETMRMYSWEQVNSNGFVPPTFTAPFFPILDTNTLGTGTNGVGVVYYGTTTLTNADVSTAYSNDVRRVIVTVSWTNDNHVAHTRTMQTMISQYGMQRYIY